MSGRNRMHASSVKVLHYYSSAIFGLFQRLLLPAAAARSEAIKTEAVRNWVLSKRNAETMPGRSSRLLTA